MKVVLKITVLDRIRNDMDDAQIKNRAVDYIVVTPKEYDELRSDRRVDAIMRYPNMSPQGSTYDMTFETRDFQLVDKSREAYARGPMYMRTYSRETIFGVKLYVVPEEYCPR